MFTEPTYRSGAGRATAAGTAPSPCRNAFNIDAREHVMSKVRVAAFSISIDGFGAGPRQDLNNPLGVRGLELHRWFLGTEAFKKMHGENGGGQGIDNDLALESFENVGAWILGRNMFGPVRGDWK